MKIKYIGSVGTRNLKFFSHVTLRRVPFTNYIVSNCGWSRTVKENGYWDSRSIEITLCEVEETKYLYQDFYGRNRCKTIRIYERIGLLDLIRLGWIYLRREREQPNQ